MPTVKNDNFNQARSNLYTTIGTTSDTISHDTIQALPQGTNAPVEKVLLQAPGVSQDSAASGSIHIRNDHANAQFRINGVMLPDGVTGFGTFLDTSMIGTIALVTGALPAEYGMRTRGSSTSRRGTTFSTIPAASAIMAAAAARFSRASNMAARSAIIVLRPRRRRDRRRRRLDAELLSGRPIFLHRQLSADHGRYRKYAADAQRHPRFLVSRKKALPICRPSSTPIRD